MSKRVFSAFLTLALFTSVVAGISITRANTQHAYAAAPATLNFQARLLNNSGAIVPDGDYNVEFKIYDHVTNGGQAQGVCSGNCLWSDTYTGGTKVSVKAGYLSVHLGEGNPLPTTIWNQQLYLTMRIGGLGSPSWDTEMTPRIKLTSVPYAFRATTAESADTLVQKTPGGFTGTVDFENLTTADRKFLFPDTSLATTASPGTICVYNGSTSNCPAATGSAYYIHNDTALQLASNFNMQARDSGVNGTVAGILRGAAAGQTVDLLQFQASGGTVLGAVTATGDLNVASTVDTYTGTTLNIGTANATAITIGDTGVTATVNGALTVSAALTSLTGATTGDALNVSNSTSTGNIAVFKDNATAVLTIADGGGITGTGTYTFSGPATDITTGTNEDLTIDANGTGRLVVNDSTVFNNVSTDITTGTNEDLTVIANGTGVINLNDNVTVGGNITFAEGANRTLSVAANATANAAGYNMTLTAGAANGSTTGNVGGTLALQGGAAAGSGNNNGGDVTLQGGAGTGTGVQGLVKLGASVFTAATSQSFGSNGNITQANIDNFSTIVVSSSVVGPITATLLAPLNSVVGRIVYVTVTGSNSIILSTPGGTPSFTMVPNSSATFVWNGSVWTNAGVDGGSNSYIQNQSSADQTANFRISGTATAPTFTSKNSTGSGNSDNVIFKSGDANSGSNNTSGTVTLKSGDATGGNASSGNLTVDTGTKTGTGTTGSISIGTTNAAAIALGYVGATTTNQGNLTVGTAAGSGTVFTNNGATLYGTKAVANDSDGGSLGGTPGTPLTAAQSVNIYTSFTVNQTTANQSITIPSPTNTAAGRIIYIANIGSASFGLLGATLNNGSTASLLWNGTAWTFAGADGTSINNQFAAAQNGDFWIQSGGSSTGVGRIDGKLLTPTIDTATAVALNIGTSGAVVTTQINLNQNTAVAAGKTLTVTSALTSLTGATTGDALNVSNSTSTGNIAVFKDNATAVLTIADGGGITGTGTYTFSGVSTDITTGTNEDLTIDANGTGKLVVNDSTTIGASAGSGTLFTNNGATLNASKAVANDSDGGSLGGTPGTPLTAAQSVDIYTSFTVNQTTANQTITLPSPTTTTAGRIIYIANIGSASFGLLGSTLNNGSTATLLWNGTAWTFAGADGTSINNQFAAAQNADFWIQAGGSSTGIGRADGGLQAPSLERASAGTLSIGTTNMTTTGITIGSTNLTGTLSLDSGASSTITIGSSASARTINIGNVAAIQGITIGSTNSTSTLNLQAGTGNANGDINIGDVAIAGKIIDIGSVTNSATSTVRIATDASAAQTVTIGSTGSTSITTLQAGSGNINFNATQAQFTEVTGTRTFTVQTRTTNVAGSALTVSAGAGGSGAGAAAGGLLTLQGGAAGGTNSNGGAVTISGGAATGTGTQGLVNLSTTAFTSAGTFTASVGSPTISNITVSDVNLFSTIPVNATAANAIVSVPDPSQAVIGRLLYISAMNGSFDFTLRLNAGSTPIDIAMKANSSASLIWNGARWTAAGASSSTDLQSAYNNTLTSAGGAEILLNPVGGNADGFTIRNNGTTPIIGGLLEVQSSTGSNLLSVNNNAAEYAVNGGAETASMTGWSNTTGGSITQNTSAAYNATGQASVSVVTTSSATNHGAKNTLNAPLSTGMTYSVSFAVKGTLNFSTLQIVYSPDGGTSGTTCATAQTVTQANWSRIVCTFVASGSINSSNAILIRQTDSASHTYYIDNLSVQVNANMTFAADGSVSSSLGSNWGTYNGAAPASQSSTVYDGQYAVSVATTGATQGVRNNMAVTPAINTQYLVTFYAKASTGTATIAAGFLPAGGNGAPAAAQQCTDYSPTQSVGSSWQRITCVITTPGSGISDPDLVIYQTDGTSRTLYIDALTINLNTNNSNNVQVGGVNKGGPTTLLTLDRASSAPIAANNDAYLGSMYYDTTTGRIQCYEADGWGACGSSPDNIITLTPEYAGAVLGGPGNGGSAGIGVMTSEFCSTESGVLTLGTLCANHEARNYYHWTSPQATEQVYSIYVTYKLPSTFKEFNDSNTIKLTALTDNTSNAIATLQVFRKPPTTAQNIASCGSATTINTTTTTWEQTSFGGDERACSFAAGDNIIFKIDMKSKSNGNIYVENLDFVYTNN